MKPKEYVKKYQTNWDRADFIRDLAADLTAQIEFHKTKQWSRVVFDNICKQMYDKYRSISFSVKQADSTLWQSFNEGIMEKILWKEFGEEIKAEQRQKAEWKKEREADERRWKARYSNPGNAFRQAAAMHFLFMMMGLGQTPIPITAFQRLEVNPDGATEETVTVAFRKLSKIYHPDIQGTGNKDIFVEIMEAREKVLSYLAEKAEQTTRKPQLWTEPAEETL